MSLKARVDADHNTLTDIVNVLGETRVEMHKRFDQQEQRFDQQDQKIEGFQQENRERFDRQDKEISEIKETLKLILSKLSQ